MFKRLALVAVLALVPLSGCTLFKAAKDEAEGKPTDTTAMTPVQKFEVTAGHLLAGLGIIVAGTLTHGLINAGTVKSLVTALDSSVPADVHGDAVAGLAASSPAPIVVTPPKV